MAREGKVKATGRIQGDQVVGLVDLGAAVRPVRKGGRATKNSRGEKDRRVPLTRGSPRRPQARIVHDLTMSSMALRVSMPGDKNGQQLKSVCVRGVPSNDPPCVSWPWQVEVGTPG